MKQCLRCGKDIQEQDISSIGLMLANFVCDEDRRSDIGWDFYSKLGDVTYTIEDRESLLVTEMEV